MLAPQGKQRSAGLEILDHPHVATEILPKNGQMPTVRRRNAPSLVASGLGAGFLLRKECGLSFRSVAFAKKLVLSGSQEAIHHAAFAFNDSGKRSAYLR